MRRRGIVATHDPRIGGSTEPVASSIAAKLASTLIGAATPRLRTAVLGDEEMQAVDRALRSAFGAMLADVRAASAPTANDEVLRLLETQLQEFAADQRASEALLDIALRRAEPPLELLRARFEAVGFSTGTFPLDFDLAMTRLAQRFAEALRSDAAMARSKLFNQVALSELERLHERLSDLERTLRPPERTRLGNAPPLPALFVGREADVAGLKAALGVTPGSGAPDGRRRVTVVRGWPGVGKTSIVATLAHDPELLAAFPDGVLWAAVGESGRAPSELAAWARHLGITVSPQQDAQQLAARIRSQLADARVLLIVDDVWRQEDAALFDVGGPASGTLFTTRLRDVATALAPAPQDVYRLGVLDERSSLELLEILAPTVVEQHEAEARALVGELEGLPLAIRVAGRLLHAEADLGWGVDELLNDIREGARLLEASAPADRAELADHTIPTVAALLKRSTDLLDDDARLKFAYLAAFAPKPAVFEVDDLAAVWETDDPRPVARLLTDRGLMEPAGGGLFSVHSLIVMHARSLLLVA